MTMLHTMRTVLLAAAVALPAACAGVGRTAAAEADAQSARTEILDGLFEKLAEADSEETADLVSASIWRIWRDSGSETVNVLLDRSIDAMQKEELEVALQVLDEVVQLAPRFAEGWNKRATVHFMLKNYGASISDIERALALEPRHFSAMTGLGTILKETGREAAALEVFRRALAINPHLGSAREAIQELQFEVEGREI